MGVQLPRSPVRLSLFRCSAFSLLCPTLFVPLSGSLAPLCTASLFRCPALSLPPVRLLCFVVRLSRSPLYGFFVSLSDSLAPLCTASLFRCPTPSLDWSCPLSHARTIYIYYLFFYMGIKSGGVASLISWRKPFPHPRRFFGFNTSCFWR